MAEDYTPKDLLLENKALFKKKRKKDKHFETRLDPNAGFKMSDFSFAPRSTG